MYATDFQQSQQRRAADPICIPQTAFTLLSANIYLLSWFINPKERRRRRPRAFGSVAKHGTSVHVQHPSILRLVEHVCISESHSKAEDVCSPRPRPQARSPPVLVPATRRYTFHTWRSQSNLSLILPSGNRIPRTNSSNNTYFPHTIS